MLNPSAQHDETQPKPNVLARTIFIEFARLGVIGFGGVLPFVRYSTVERNRWLNDREFSEMLSIGQILPGGNVLNLSVMLGFRLAGWRGSFAAIFGLLLIPVILLLTLATLYRSFSGNPAIQHVMTGMAAVAAGLVVATGLKLAASQPKTLRGALFGVSVFVMIILFHWPLVFVLAGTIPPALLLEYLYNKQDFSHHDNNIK
jgi:chromate transporter